MSKLVVIKTYIEGNHHLKPDGKKRILFHDFSVVQSDFYPEVFVEKVASFLSKKHHARTYAKSPNKTAATFV